MKKLLSALFITICISIIVPHKLYAVDVSAGAATWFAWINQDYTANLHQSSKTKNNPTLFFGPALSLRLNEELNVTFVYLYGKFSVTEDPANDRKLGYKLKRNDADLLLNYRLNDYFKAFVGLKYITLASKRSFSTGVHGAIYEIEHSGAGPGVGLSCAYPITPDIFFLANLSVFSLRSRQFAGYFDSSITQQQINTKSIDYGINFNPAIAYYIAKASTTVSLGGRFQHIKTSFSTKANPAHGSYYNHDSSTFYGVTLTATYSFTIPVD